MLSEYDRLPLIKIGQFNFLLNSASQKNIKGHVQQGLNSLIWHHRMIRENFEGSRRSNQRESTALKRQTTTGLPTSKARVKWRSFENAARCSYCYADATRHTKQSKQRTPKLLCSKDCLAACTFSSRALYTAVTFDRCEHVQQGVTLELSSWMTRQRSNMKLWTDWRMRNRREYNTPFRNASRCHHMKLKQVVVRICGDR